MSKNSKGVTVLEMCRQASRPVEVVAAEMMAARSGQPPKQPSTKDGGTQK